MAVLVSTLTDSDGNELVNEGMAAASAHNSQKKKAEFIFFPAHLAHGLGGLPVESGVGDFPLCNCRLLSK